MSIEHNRQAEKFIFQSTELACHQRKQNIYGVVLRQISEFRNDRLSLLSVSTLSIVGNYALSVVWATEDLETLLSTELRWQLDHRKEI